MHVRHHSLCIRTTHISVFSKARAWPFSLSFVDSVSLLSLCIVSLIAVERPQIAEVLERDVSQFRSSIFLDISKERFVNLHDSIDVREECIRFIGR
jgi:hypothetical protein